MTQAQPLRVPASAASRIHTRDPHVARLVDLWVDLAALSASAAAHGCGDEAQLRLHQLQVEDAITDRMHRPGTVLAQLLAWEADLIHVAQTPPEDCLICRRARLGLPLELPFPATAGRRS
jgi:hypothetical protein